MRGKPTIRTDPIHRDGKPPSLFTLRESAAHERIAIRQESLRMKLSDMKYERPDYEKTAGEYERLLDALEKAENAEAFLPVFWKINQLRTRIETMSALCSIRHSINTKDAFYDAEKEYWDKTWPLYQAFESRLGSIAVNCPFRETLTGVIPETYFRLAECALRSFSEEIIPLLQKENLLCSEYAKLTASAEIEFEGKIYNLSSINERAEDPDPMVRRGAMDAMLGFFEENEENLDTIYDRLVKVRTEIAKTLGYATFTELAYQRMKRLDYDRNMVESYRKQILEDIVPVTSKLYRRQAKRLHTDRIHYYDLRMEFLSHNPIPKGSYEQQIQSAWKMYHEMSGETGEFIDLMMEEELWDLKSKDGKEMGGYCNSIPGYEVPFIFANFNGTSHDVNVLTHEAGHAFQYYLSRQIPVLDLQWPTMESAEIASMTMEFNAWPWLSLFFEEDAEKYRFLHLSGTLKFLPYGVLVDHFQHEVYDHPDWTKEERKQCWRRLEKQYQPDKDYEGADLLERGGWWYRQLHIFEVPFYYIDYTLAQVCALQFWVRQTKKDPEAWTDYLKLCRLGGTLPFTELVRSANLRVPFEEGCLKEVVKSVNEYLASVEDESL